jgi:hypothetical protein
MTKDQMLRRAEECRVSAEAAEHLEAKQALLEVADTWERLPLRRSIAEIEIGIAEASGATSTHGNGRQTP